MASLLAGIVGTIYDFETPISREIQKIKKDEKEVYKERVLYNPHNYFTYFKKLNCHACLLSPEGDEKIIAYLDLVVIPGGYDVHPSLYGQEAQPETQYEKGGIRDRFEKRLIELALEWRKPIFAVCRGFQMVNVVLGGTLHQHLPRWSTLISHRPIEGPEVLAHSVQTTGWLAEAVGSQIEVNSWHHQGIDRLAPALEPLAWSADGLVEAYQGNENCPTPIFAVQWHPEILQDQTSMTMLRKFLEKVFFN